MFAFLGCECTLWGHVPPLIHQQMGILLRAAFHSLSSLYLCLDCPNLGAGLCTSRCHVHTGPPPRPVQVPLWHPFPQGEGAVDSTTWPDELGRLAGGVLDPTVHDTSEGVTPQ